MLKTIIKTFRNYLLITGGAAAVVFGVTVPVVVTAVGMTVDMSQAFVTRERLSRALDAAALAGAAMETNDESLIQDRVDRFLTANYPDDVIGQRITMDVELDTENDLLTVSARAKLDTAFMGIIGKDVIYVDAETTVQREVRGLEVVLVLDNTGSMNTNNNIGALKDATLGFIDIMYEAIEDDDEVRIGLVPYSSSVNVGPYGIGLDEAGVPLPSGGFVETPADDIYYDYTHNNFYNDDEYGIAEVDLVYDQTNFGQWHGCVLAEEYPLDTEDHAGPWQMYRYDFNGSTNNWYSNNWQRLGGTWYTNGDNYNSYYGPNYHCPRQKIVPLTNNRAVLEAATNNMGAEGFTLGNYGMVWGWRVISPELPFDEGSEYTDPEWEKAVIMMTDGNNTMNHAYTAYGLTNTHSVRPDEENARFIEVCDNMKEENVLIYTVTFYSNISDDTKEFYRECATDPTKYYDAPSQEDLEVVFAKIARELSKLHITE
ncbi:MAG: vWA domain-containing protein [Pseudomonadota bacterium]